MIAFAIQWSLRMLMRQIENIGSWTELSMSLSVWEKEKGTLLGETGPLNGCHDWSIPFLSCSLGRITTGWGKELLWVMGQVGNSLGSMCDLATWLNAIRTRDHATYSTKRFWGTRYICTSLRLCQSWPRDKILPTFLSRVVFVRGEKLQSLVMLYLHACKS